MAARQKPAGYGRLEARISPEQKALFQRAAELEGQTLTAFVVASARRAAEETIRAHEVITLSERDSRAFVEALLHPGPPSPRLRQAFERRRVILEDV